MDLWGSMDIGYDLDETRDTLNGGKLRDSRKTQKNPSFVSCDSEDSWNMEHDRKHEGARTTVAQGWYNHKMLGITIGVYRIYKEILKHIKQHT